MNSKNLMSVIFPAAILGPEMAAPILWAPGIFWFFLLETPHAHKIPPFKGGGWGFLERRGKCQFYYYGRGDFSAKAPVSWFKEAAISRLGVVLVPWRALINNGLVHTRARPSDRMEHGSVILEYSDKLHLRIVSFKPAHISYVMSMFWY